MRNILMTELTIGDYVIAEVELNAPVFGEIVAIRPGFVLYPYWVLCHYPDHRPEKVICGEHEVIYVGSRYRRGEL
jgi:hypothetical protein